MQMARLTNWQSNHSSKFLLQNDFTLTSKLNVRSHLILYVTMLYTLSPRKASLLNITLVKYFSHRCGHRTKKNPKTKKPRGFVVDTTERLRHYLGVNLHVWLSLVMGRDKKTKAWKKGQWTSACHGLITHHTQAIYTFGLMCYTHEFMGYFFVNSSCPWQNANNV